MPLDALSLGWSAPAKLVAGFAGSRRRWRSPKAVIFSDALAGSFVILTKRDGADLRGSGWVIESTI